MSADFDEENLGKLTREEWLARADKVSELAWIDALDKVEQMALGSELVLPREISGLHPRSNTQYTRTFDVLHGEFEGRLPALFAYAQWMKWVAGWDGAYWFMHSIEQGVVLDNDSTRARCTAEGYALHEGWSYAVFNKQGEFNRHKLYQTMAERYGLGDRPSDYRVLSALELHWLWLASDQGLEREKFLEYLYEAGEASALASGLHMWDEGVKCSLEEMESDPNSKAALSARRLLAKAAAEARHAPNQAIREKVVARYKDEREKYSSKDSAAFAFTKDFPFEFSTIRDWLKGV
ncbi:MAG: hypothetical protein RR779_15315 [Comamonas sp.]